MDYALGIDVGATNVKAVAVTAGGEALQRDRFATRDGAAEAWMATIRDYVRAIESKFGQARWLGIACPGLVARDGRSVAWMKGRIAAVQGLDWTEHLGRAELSPVINDAHAALMGEIWLGAGRDAQNAAMLTLGTGVGGAVLCDGRLLRGSLGRAGHLGHITMNPDGLSDIVGMPGSLEDAIGDCTIATRSDGRFESTIELLQGVRAKDEHALQIWRTSIKALAAGIASIINCIDPEVVILGGGISQEGRLLTDPLERYMNQFEWRPFGESVPIVLAKLGEYAGALGAARNAMQI
jgi:glucokinase